MDIKPSSSLDQLPRDDTSSVLVEQPTQPATPPVVVSEKKSHKRAIIMAIVGVLLIAAALLGYVLYDQMNKTTETDTTPDTPKSTVVSPLDQTTKVYTDGANEESDLTNSDDSSDASDASNSASNVGDSINENNL